MQITLKDMSLAVVQDWAKNNSVYYLLKTKTG